MDGPRFDVDVCASKILRSLRCQTYFSENSENFEVRSFRRQRSADFSQRVLALAHANSVRAGSVESILRPSGSTHLSDCNISPVLCKRPNQFVLAALLFRSVHLLMVPGRRVAA